DADLDNATTQIMNAAFGSAGERCMAAAVVAVEETIADEFVKQLKVKVQAEKMGNGLEDDVFLGPVIRKEHHDRTMRYINTGEEEGANLVLDGRQVATTDQGYFVGASIFDHVKTNMKIW